MRSFAAVSLLVLALALAACSDDAPGVPDTPATRGTGFRTWLWCFDEERPDPELLRLLGVTGVNLERYVDPDVLSGTGLDHYVGHAAGKGVLHLAKGDLPHAEDARPVRKYCLSDPAVLAKLARHLDESLERHAGAGPVAVALEDEVSLGTGARPLDLCWGPHCLAGFRRWLAGEYGTVAALNREWGTEYGSFAEVEPVGTPEIRKRTVGRPRRNWNLAPWADHRAFMDDVVFRAIDGLLARAKERAPGIPFGVLGGLFPAAFGGQDPIRLLPRLGFVEIYDTGGMKPVVRSLVRPDAVVVQTVFSTGGEERVARNRLWSGWAHGEDGAVIWSNREFVADGEPTSYARWLSGTLRELTGPLGEALVGARPLDDGVGIVVSQASVRVGWMLDSEEDGKTWPRRLTSWEAGHSSVLLARVAAERLLEDAGLAYRIVPEAELAAGELAGSGLKALLLPKTVALSDEAVAGIRAFVAGGGVVIADFATARFDAHGRSREGGALDDLFGVARKEGAVRESGGWPDRSQHALFAGAVVMEPGLFAADGTPAGRVAGVPVGVRKRAGDGFAVYLNLGLPDYLEARRSPGGGAELENLVKGYLSEAGIRPRVSVVTTAGRPPDRVLCLSYRRESDEALVLIRNWQVEDLRGRPGDLAGTEGLSAAPLRIVLPEPRRVIDGRTGKDHGKVQALDVTLPPLEALVYFLE